MNAHRPSEGWPNGSDILRARQRLVGVVPPTPLVSDALLCRRVGLDLRCKLDHTLPASTIDFRGAANVIASTTEDLQTRGVCSSGRASYVLAMAHAARLFGVDHVAFVPPVLGSDPGLLDSLRALGTRVFVRDDAASAALEHAVRTGRAHAECRHDERFVAGVGTSALETIEQWGGGVDVLYVPVGTGSTLVGMATIVRLLSPRTRIIGVQPEASAATARAWRTGEHRSIRGAPTLAGELAVGRPEARVVGRLRELVDDVTTVNEREIARAMRTCAESFRQIVDGGSAVALAAALRQRAELRGKRVAVCLPGVGAGGPVRVPASHEQAA